MTIKETDQYHKRRLDRREFLRWLIIGTGGTLLAACGAPVPQPAPSEEEGEVLGQQREQPVLVEGEQKAPPPGVRREFFVLEEMAKAVGQPNTDPLGSGSQRVEVGPSGLVNLEGFPAPKSLSLRQVADWWYAYQPPYGQPPSRRTGAASETPPHQVVCTDVPALLAYYSYDLPTFVIDPSRQSWLRNTKRLRDWFEGGTDSNANNNLTRKFWDNVDGTIGQTPQPGDVLWFDTSRGAEAHVGAVVEVGDDYSLVLEARGLRAGADLETDRQNNLAWVRYDFVKESQGVQFLDSDVSGLGRVYK